MSRKICQRCHFPCNVCLCDVLKPVTSRSAVWVLQHPSETDHGKNSARLLPLMLDKAQIVVGETAADFAGPQAQIQAQGLAPVLVYPAEAGEAVFTPAANAPEPENRLLILLDGTWRKALKMYHLNPWLHTLPKLALSPEKPSAYRIRKARRADSLSTLEAAAEALTQLEPQLDVSALYEAFDAMVSRRLAAMPEAVRQRYLRDESNT
ncbi:tRNA-uridine aminocarboxypropyltransferase [Shewanella khirikhana]|uniref:tRNA-uridine aminocarboxypropyltransferase n=1 Tax=Shewanella khirikhana TaxID=1965282 RepID=A0ABM7DRW8_9GAMM|nr:tRNA-uridine aminocarboxypropyltransferase [Shewanella khirikhana]AZQ12447.1 DTW domain protein [Shewanella khirikhana]